MLRLYARAAQLFSSNFLLFAAVILTVAVPGNLLVRYVLGLPRGGARLLSAIAALLAAFALAVVAMGAMVHVVDERNRGRRTGWARAMRVGLRNWLRLFAANAVVLVFVLLGVLAFVVPAVLFCIWYAMIDPVVVLEHAGPTQALRRSKELTRGMRWPIFATLTLWALLHAGAEWLNWWLPRSVEFFASFWAKAMLDCLEDVLFGIVGVVLVLFYLQAREREETRSTPREVPQTRQGPGEL